MLQADEGNDHSVCANQQQACEAFRAGGHRPENLGIAAAIAVCEEAVGHGGAKSGQEAEDCSEPTLEVAALASWASESDLWVPDLVPDELKDAGTREHLLFHRDEEP